MYKKGGLAHFETGGSTDDADENQAPVYTKPVKSASKSGLQFPTPTGDIPLSKGVLDSMERMYQERQADYGGFMEGMKDAYAWWSGDIEGPQKALSRRAQEREQQSSNLFNLRTQIAQGKAAQERENQARDTFLSIVGSGGGAAGVGSGAGGGGGFTYGGVPISQGDASRLMQIGQTKGFTTALNELSSLVGDIEKGSRGFANQPGAYDTTKATVIIRDERGKQLGTEQVSPLVIRRLQEAGISEPTFAQLDQARMNALPRSSQRPMPAPPSDAAPKPIQGAAPAPQAPSAAAAPPAPSMAPPAPAPTQGMAKPPMPAPAKPAPAPVPAQMAPTTPPAPAPAPAPARAPVAPMQAMAGPRKTTGDIARETEIGQKRSLGTVEQDVKMEGARAEKIIDRGQAADARIQQTTGMINLLKNNEKAFGLGAVPGITGATIAITEKGITLPIVGTARAEGFSDALASLQSSPREQEARKKFDALASNIAAEYRKDLYSGTGPISDSESKAAQVATGLEGTKQSMLGNLMFARLHQERAMVQKKRYEAYTDWKTRNPTGSLLQFERTEEYKRPAREMDANIREAFPNIFGSGTGEKPSLSSFRRK